MNVDLVLTQSKLTAVWIFNTACWGIRTSYKVIKVLIINKNVWIRALMISRKFECILALYSDIICRHVSQQPECTCSVIYAGSYYEVFLYVGSWTISMYLQMIMQSYLPAIVRQHWSFYPKVSASGTTLIWIMNAFCPRLLQIWNPHNQYLCILSTIIPRSSASVRSWKVEASRLDMQREKISIRLCLFQETIGKKLLAGKAFYRTRIICLHFLLRVISQDRGIRCRG